MPFNIYLKLQVERTYDMKNSERYLKNLVF